MINKKLFEVDKNERDRILSLHESATKKQYLPEEAEDTSGLFDFLKRYTKEEIKKGAEILEQLRNTDNFAPSYWTIIANTISKTTANNPYATWASMESNGFPKKVRKAFEEAYEQEFMKSSDVDDKVEGAIGRYFLQNPGKMSMVQDIVSKTSQEMMDMVKSFSAKPPQGTTP